MKKCIFTLSIIFVIFTTLLVVGFNNGLFLSTYVFPNDEDVKLKFVSGDNVREVASSNVILYVNKYKKVYEENEYIVFVMDENEVIYSPFDADVSRSDDKVILKNGNLKIEIYNLKVVCVKDGFKLKKKEVIGTIGGTLLKVKVFYNDKRLSLNKIKGFL